MSTMIKAILAPALVMKKTSLYGSFNSRLVAVLIDHFILLFWHSIIFYFTTTDPQLRSSWDKNLGNSDFSLGMFLLAFKALFFNFYFPVAHWLYYTLLEASPKQATVGKFALGLKVTDLRGKRIGLAQANIRYFSKIVSVLPLLFGIFHYFISRRRQMLHDFIASTLILTRNQNK